jgi:hypothetical protein
MAKYTREEYIDQKSGEKLSVKVYKSGRIEFFLPGTALFHRCDGPAQVYADGKGYFFIDGEMIESSYFNTVVAEYLDDRGLSPDDVEPPQAAGCSTIPYHEILPGVWFMEKPFTQVKSNFMSVLLQPFVDVLNPDKVAIFFFENEIFVIPDYKSVEHRTSGYYVHLSSGDTWGTNLQCMMFKKYLKNNSPHRR